MLLHAPAGAWVLAATALVDVAAAAWVWHARKAVGRLSLVVVLLAGAVWSGCYALELLTTGRGVQEFWGGAEYVGTTVLPPAWLAFVLEYTGRRQWLTRRLLVLLAIEPVVVVTLLLLPGTHDLIRSFAPGPLAAIPVVRLGPAYWFHFAYTNLLAVAATGLLAARLLRVSSLYRRQVVILTVSVLLPLLGNLASSIGLPVAKAYDPTPVFVSVGGLVLVWGAFRYRLLDLLPVARTMTFDRLDDPVLVVDAFGRIVDRNPAAARLLGAGALIGAPVQHVLQRQAADLDATASGAEIRVVDRDGETREFELVTSSFAGPRGGHAGRLVHLREITARKRAELRLRWLADYDPLTGLPNRRLLSDRLDQAIARARRAGTRCALLLVDLDRFKLINDSLGHPTGDAVLAEVAQRLRAGRRDEDTAARLGGDEFAVLLPEVTNTDDAAIVARRVLAGLSAPIHLQDREFIVTASVGVAVWPDDGSEPLELFGRADAAMYRAKAHGRNRVESGPSDGTQDAAQRLELGVDLWHALRRGELHLLYQPIVDLRTDRVIALEALVRWHHPKLGLLTPAAFLPVAQEAGLSTDLDRWVLGHACAQAAAWRREGHPTPVTVNVSAERFRDDPHSLQPDVTAALARTGLPPHLLVLEINERTVIHEPEPVAEELRALRDLGVGLALDDFGAGHTSLTHLRALPIELLKIDQSLVRGIAGDGDDRRILAAVVTLAGILGMRIIAEGVERPAQLEALRLAGCDAGQGVHLQPPLEPAAASALLAGTDVSGRATAVR